MSCNCNEYKDPCTHCNTCPETDDSCNCVQKDMSTDCIVYTGDDLECSGIPQTTILTTLIQNLDTFICNLRDEIYAYIVQRTTLINIGGGSEIYKQDNPLGNKELRSLEQGDDIIVTQEENTIRISNVPSTESIRGVSQIATQAEVDSGVDNTKYITPLKLNTYLDDPNTLPNATEIQRGVIEIATQTEVNTGTDSERAITPSTLNNRTASETLSGIIQIATQAEVDSGVDNTKAVVPSTLNSYISDPVNLPNSTTNQRGIAEIATQAEVDAGIDDEKFITPAKLETRLGGGGLSISATVVTLPTWSLGTVTSGLNHGIGVTPITTNIHLICTVANNGYSVGDVVKTVSRVQDRDESGSGGGTFRRGITVNFNNTNTSTYTLNVGAELDIPSNLDITEINPDPTQWDIQIVFFHI